MAKGHMLMNSPKSQWEYPTWKIASSCLSTEDYKQ